MFPDRLSVALMTSVETPYHKGIPGNRTSGPLGCFPCPVVRSLGRRGPLYRVPEILTLGRFLDAHESDSTWRTEEVRHVGSDTIAPRFWCVPAAWFGEEDERRSHAESGATRTPIPAQGGQHSGDCGQQVMAA